MNKRFEAGLRPPLQPRNIESSLAASSLRPENISIIPFHVVTDAVIAELNKDAYVMPSEQKVPHSFRIGKPTVVLATTNGIREEDFKKKIPHAQLRRIPFEEEPTADSFLAAKSKADSAASYESDHRSMNHIPAKLREIRQRGLWQAPITVGLDEINAIPQLQPDGTIQFVQLGKPDREAPGEELELIRTRLATLSQMALKNEWPAIPMIIEMTHYLRNTSRRGRDGRFDAYSTKRIAIMLDPTVLAYLSTPEGYLEYLQLSLASSPQLTQTAAGMKREVFEKTGAILFISDDPAEIASMQFDPSKQAKKASLADRLAKGKLHPRLMNEYIAKL